MNDKPRIATYQWSQMGRVGIWNNHYDEFGNPEDLTTDAQWEVIRGHKFVRSFNTHTEATAYVREGLTK